MLNCSAASADLILRVLEHFVGERAGKADHQVGIPQLVLQAPGRLYKYLRFAVVFFTTVIQGLTMTPVYNKIASSVLEKQSKAN